jgi:hypothetical protein
MSPRSSDGGPSPGIYEGLLFVSLAAVIMGIVFLILELNQYGWKVAG